MPDQGPPRLTLVLEDLLRIEGWTPDLEAACTGAGFHLARDEWNHLCVRYAREPADLRANQSAIRAFQFLVSQGVAFARDQKQTYDPAFAIEYLREVGLIEGSVLTCAFDGKRWRVERAA